MAGKASLTLDGNSHEYNTLSGTVGPDVVDIRKLYADTDVFTYDPGFTSTASCQSAITYIDGDAGILLHRGYPIDQLAENSTFMEVCYLLLNGELPSGDELSSFTHTISCSMVCATSSHGCCSMCSRLIAISMARPLRRSTLSSPSRVRMRPERRMGTMVSRPSKWRSFSSWCRRLRR